jgi:hypothetical protein
MSDSEILAVAGHFPSLPQGPAPRADAVRPERRPECPGLYSLPPTPAEVACIVKRRSGRHRRSMASELGPRPGVPALVAAIRA